MSGEILPPDPARPRPGATGGTPGPEVGSFRGDALTAAALARYLVGRVLVERVSISLWVAAGTAVVVAVLAWFFAAHWLGVVIGVIALMIAGFRVLLLAVLRRLLAFGRFGPAEEKVRALVSDSQGDMRRELKRVGLPSTVFTMPLLVPRLISRRRRRRTLDAVGRFDVQRVIPPHRQDEFAFVVRDSLRNRPV